MPMETMTNELACTFALFLEYLELSLQNGQPCGLSIHEMCIIILLFADDMVIMSNHVIDLQNNLNKLQTYCDVWGLKVNVAITKIVVFRKLGPLRQDEIWNYNDQLLEDVQEFNYVGVVFNVSGLFHLNNQYVIGKALRASSMLLHNIFKYEVKPSIVLQLFDIFVGSVLTICSRSKTDNINYS